MTGRVDARGRVHIPASLRRELGWHPGERLAVGGSHETITIRSARSLAEAMWARNPRPYAARPVTDEHAWREVHPPSNAAPEDDLARDLLSRLGLTEA